MLNLPVKDLILQVDIMRLRNRNIIEKIQGRKLSWSFILSPLLRLLFLHLKGPWPYLGFKKWTHHDPGLCCLAPCGRWSGSLHLASFALAIIKAFPPQDSDVLVYGPLDLLFKLSCLEVLSGPCQFYRPFQSLHFHLDYNIKMRKFPMTKTKLLQWWFTIKRCFYRMRQGT